MKDKIFWEELYASMSVKLAETDEGEITGIDSLKMAIKTTKSVLNDLRSYISNFDFPNNKSEIEFFKIVKPKFLSKLIYYRKVLNFEFSKPASSSTQLSTFYENELNSLKFFHEMHEDFYKYYKNGDTFWDEYFFMRSADRTYGLLQFYVHEVDPLFSTGFDQLVSEILANEEVSTYLHRCIDHCNTDYAAPLAKKSQLTWTASKAGIGELIYALYASGVFNNTQADIKKISDHFSVTFNIDIGNIYKIFEEIRLRKKSRTSFIDNLKQNLISKMDFDDEHAK